MTRRQKKLIECVIEIAATRVKESPKDEWWPVVSEILGNVLKVESEQSKHFDLFWSAYPRKVGKPSALKSWKRLGCDEIASKVIQSVQEWAKTDDWRKDSGQFVPYPATWLNREGWNDQIKVNVTANHAKTVASEEWTAFLAEIGAPKGRYGEFQFAPSFLREQFLSRKAKR